MVTTSFLVGRGMGAGHLGASALGGLHDLLCALVDDLMIIGFQPDADLSFCAIVLIPPDFVGSLNAVSTTYGERIFYTLNRAYHSSS